MPRHNETCLASRQEHVFPCILLCFLLVPIYNPFRRGPAILLHEQHIQLINPLPQFIYHSGPSAAIVPVLAFQPYDLVGSFVSHGPSLVAGQTY